MSVRCSMTRVGYQPGRGGFGERREWCDQPHAGLVMWVLSGQVVESSPFAASHLLFGQTEKYGVWEEFYNVHRPHAGLQGQTPYEVIREKLLV